MRGLCNVMEREALERENRTQGNGASELDLNERVRALEAAYLAKAEEEQRTDPRHWSPIRQQWEAFKGIKQLISGPHEQIPEAFLRNALAGQYGIKPEEVTWEQIRFAVSGDLLRHYGAVTVIPSKTTDAEIEVRSTDDHRAEVDAFLFECNKLSDKRIRRRHIWQSVGHLKGRQFEYWQANDVRATKADHSNFRRILREGPEKFLATLRAKKLA